MQTFMGISNSTAGRALVVPQSNTEVYMGMGEYEWLHILRYLTSGQNLKDAVNSANADVIAAYTGTAWTPQAWQVIGDSGNGGTGIKFLRSL